MKILLAVDSSECGDVVVEEVARRPWPADSALRIISVAGTNSPRSLTRVAQTRPKLSRRQTPEGP